MKTIPITLITGYLGSGKTTLINNILKNDKGYKIAVIVNDIGSVNIDADLIQKGGVVSLQSSSLVALQNGCICCNLNADLIKQILELCKSNKFDHIMIEASGICEPLPIVQSIVAIQDECRKRRMQDICKIDAVISVTDALRLAREFGCGDDLEKENIDEEDIENLIIQQLEFCDIVLLNKTKEISTEELNKVKAVIRKIQPTAKLYETNFSNIDIDKIVDTSLFDFEKSISSAGWLQEMNKDVKDLEEHHHHEHHHDDDDDEDEHEHHSHHEHHHHDHDETTTEEYGISTFVYFRREPLNRQKFVDWINQNWGKQIIRSKGLVYFDDFKDMSYIFEQAGTQKNLGEAGFWYATMPKAEFEEMVRQDPTVLNDWDEKYGDRMVKLVFIGQHMDKANIIKTLDEM